MSAQWTTAREYTDIKYETTDDGSIAKITINRPQVRNAFRPQTVHEMLNALNAAHEDPKVGVVILTGEGFSRACLPENAEKTPAPVLRRLSPRPSPHTPGSRRILSFPLTDALLK